MSNAHLDDPDELMEKGLRARLAEVEIGIAKLSAEKTVLWQMITRVMEKRVKVIDVTRKNSIDRIIVEDRISEILGKYKTHVDGKFLFGEIRSIKPEINKATFRSHLNRMKNKGMIKPSGKRGFWILP
jgi:hypothetical protein